MFGFKDKMDVALLKEFIYIYIYPYICSQQGQQCVANQANVVNNNMINLNVNSNLLSEGFTKGVPNLDF